MLLNQTNLLINSNNNDYYYYKYIRNSQIQCTIERVPIHYSDIRYSVQIIL